MRESSLWDCIECYQTTTACLAYCMEQGGHHASKEHLTLLMECAHLCQASATLLTLQGQFSLRLCHVCAQVCEACAQSCAAVDEQDATMQLCAEACLRCAKSCRAMAV